MSRQSGIRVMKPGMFTTIQDLGRRGWNAVGVVRGGAADTLSLRAGNRLVGNEDGAAALEMTLVGGTFEFERDAWGVLTDGNTSACIEGNHGERPTVGWIPFEIQAGERLKLGPIEVGVRAYLCVSGGITVPKLLGSRSTHLSGGFGGLDGRPLRNDDVIPLADGFARVCDTQAAERARAFCESVLARRSLRAVDGAHLDTFDDGAIQAFWASEFEVSMQSDRTGLRLNEWIGASSLGGRMPSEGMMRGAVQVPGAGAPIILMADHPTTGGYPVIACVAAVDHAALGQVRPRDTLRFDRVSRSEARSLFAEQERRFNAKVPPP